jgi:hypothetical protein
MATTPNMLNPNRATPKTFAPALYQQTKERTFLLTNLMLHGAIPIDTPSIPISLEALHRLSTRLVEDEYESVHIHVGIVQRSRSNTNDIRLPLINDDAFLLQDLHYGIQHTGLEQDAQLRSAFGWIGGRDDGIRWVAAWIPLQALFEVCCQINTFFADFFHRGHGKDVQACNDGGHVEGARIAELPSTGTLDGDKDIVHLEAARLVASPPAAQAWCIFGLFLRFHIVIAIGKAGGYFAVLFVDKESTDYARTAVHVLVVAPCGEVDVPVMQLERHVADGMSQIPSNFDTKGVAVTRDELYVKELAAVVLDAGEEDQCG